MLLKNIFMMRFAKKKHDVMQTQKLYADKQENRMI